MICAWLSTAKVVLSQASGPPFFSDASKVWADSVFETLSYEERLGQLFMVDAFSNKDSLHVAKIEQLIRDYHIGGLIFFQGGPVRQADLTNHYQSISRIPLLIGIDGEWGLQMRLDSTIRFPRQMTLAAGSTEEDVYMMGLEIGRQCRRMGIHVNFAPDVDVNNNPLNPIINSRSFGEDKYKVAQFGAAYMRGLQEQNVLACGKHFPGHGDTDSDSHHSLPIVRASKERIDSLELFPFKQLIRQGLGSVMVAHLFLPSIDTTPDRAGTLSPFVVNGLLKDSLGFKGLVFTDALNMKGVAAYYPPGEIEKLALLAGNDVLLYSQDIPAAIDAIHKAVQDCEMEQSYIDEKVKKILQVKHWCGLGNLQQVSKANLYQDLNTNDAAWLAFRLFNQSSVLISNKSKALPLKPHDRFCLASIVLNDTLNNVFQQQLSAYAPVDIFSFPKESDEEFVDSIVKVLRNYDRVIVSVHNSTINAAKNFGLSPAMISVVHKLSHQRGNILVSFGNPFVLSRLEGLSAYAAVVQAFEDTRYPQSQVAQKLFGAGIFKGKMPVSIPGQFVNGDGIGSEAENVLRFSMPQVLSMNAEKFNVIDSLVRTAIADSVFPGCQVLIAHKGVVIYDKCFGGHIYGEGPRVSPNDLYDVASVTKLASTALAAMYLVDKHKLNPDEKASKYLHELRKTDKRDITIRQLMTHESGLKAWIPFWKETVTENGFDSLIYKFKPEPGYTTMVAGDLYIKNAYSGVLWSKIVQSPLESVGKYVYSDLSMVVLQKVIEKVSGKSIDQLLQDEFYHPMGLWCIGFNPYRDFQKTEIVPTETDSAFRKQTILGTVHDPMAAMMGGIGGHAGLFSNARSLGVLMQMLLNNGVYGRNRYLSAETIQMFTSKANPASNNRRGFVFDKPDASLGENSPAAKSASSLAFGHSGFTGTCVWADPGAELLYVFLSNRVYPSAANNKLAKSNLRTKIMQVAYDALPPFISE